LGLVRYQHLRTEYRGGAIYCHVIRKRDERRCAGCRAHWDQLTMQGKFERSFRALPVRRRLQFAVLDLETGHIIHTHEGKDAHALIPFLSTFKRKKTKILAVAMDMSPAYLQAVRHVFPEVDIVHDPYHVVTLVNKAIDETRRDMVRQISGQDKQLMKGSRFLLLSSLESLKPSSLESLMMLMELNEPLYARYLLKEDLRTFWNLPNQELGAAFLDSWIHQAKSLGLRHFSKVAATLNRHRQGLLSYFKHRISTGPLEGLNNKIKVLKRQAYSFRDMDYFKLRAVEGLAVSQPYKGCRVADISMQHAYETYQIEAVLEGFAAFLATNLIREYELKNLKILSINLKK
jgi:transposase